VVAERACSCGAEAQRQRELCEGHTSCVYPYVGIGVVSWTGGIQVSTLRNEGRQRTLPMRLHARFQPRQLGQRGRRREASSSSSWSGHPGWSSDGRQQSSG
jgi:hypothetical protein